MTHTSTEQLHQFLELVLTELDRKAIPVAYMQEIDRKGKAFIEQAARRAPAVPQFSRVAQKKLDYLLEAGEEITGYAFQNKDGRRGSIDCHGFVAWWHDAAAPQPPEKSNSVEFHQIKQTAPVQMPEYGIDTANHAGIRVRGYTEHQVRQLLAAHGIGKGKA